MYARLENAACKGLDVDLFYPMDTDGGIRSQIAKSVCNKCPEKLACKELGRDEYFGIWGGERKVTPRSWRRK